MPSGFLSEKYFGRNAAAAEDSAEQHGKMESVPVGVKCRHVSDCYVLLLALFMLISYRYKHTP